MIWEILYSGSWSLGIEFCSLDVNAWRDMQIETRNALVKLGAVLTFIG